VSDRSVDRLVEVVAPGYCELPYGDAAGLLLMPVWGDALAPFALKLTEVDEDVGPDGDQEELGAPEICDFALLAQAERLGEEDALEVYWLALAARVHELLGIPVLVHELDVPIAEQYRRQTNTRETDPLAGMDVLVRVDVDEHQVAAVTLREGMWMSGIARGTDPHESVPLGPGLSELRRDPQVVAGVLPRGAAGVRVQDRRGVWHEAAVGRGAWLCVLPQRSRGDEQPPFAYLGFDGAPIELGEDAWVIEQPPDLRADEAAVRAGALVPAVWFSTAHGSPIFAGWDGPRERATALRFTFGGWDVRISAEPVTTAEVFEQRLIRVHGYGTRGARKRMRDVTLSSLPGTLDDGPVTLELAAFAHVWDRAGGWTAVLDADTFTVAVEGDGTPPERIDLERADR
jgi:hypothetical protein